MKILTRMFSMALAIVLLCSVFPVSAFAAEQEIMYGIGFVNANGLRLRSQANTTSSDQNHDPNRDYDIL